MLYKRQSINIIEPIVPWVNSNIELDLSKLYLLSNGDIIFADTAEDETVGKCVEISGVESQKVVSGLHTIALRPKIQYAPHFLGYYLNSTSYHNQLIPLMQGIKVLSINRSALANTILLLPKSLAEQKAIGEYFHNLDMLISAKRQKLVKLRNIKRACLDKMFVNTSEL